MSLRINQNIDAFNAYRNLSITQGQMSKSLEKLSSGFRINRAADDAAGLAISEGLRSQVGGLKVAVRNAQDGISVVQTTEGALTEVHAILQRMRDLAVQGANDTNNAESRQAITDELGALGEELTRIASGTNFNGISLLSDTATDLAVQVGAGSDAATNAITVDLTTNNLTGIIGGVTALDITDAASATAAIDALDTALGSVSDARSNLGAVQNRLEYAVKNINVSAENLAAAESRIRDADMAKEMMEFSRTNILSQAGTAMLAQANQSTSGVLQLLG